MNTAAIRKPSVSQLMDTPLQQLVDELHVELTASGITDPGFTGYMYADRRGVTVALPADRSELEYDCMARYLIGRAFDVDDLPELPDMFRVHDMTAEANEAHRRYQAATGDSAPDMDEALRRVREGGAR